jgi:hypothetical protein
MQSNVSGKIFAGRTFRYIRIALAKHQVPGKAKQIAYAPGYGRINQWCGSLDYQLERGRVILGQISRRDIADELRAMGDRASVPSEDDLKSFDEFMKDHYNRRLRDLCWRNGSLWQ